MRNYKGSDEIVTRVAPGGGVVAGTPVVIGSEFLVPQSTAAATVEFAAVKRGEVKLPSESTDTFTAGLKVYWNPTSGKVEDSDSASNYEIGTAQAAASGGYVIVALNGVGLGALTGDLANKIDKVPGIAGMVPKMTAAGGVESSTVLASALAVYPATAANLSSGVAAADTFARSDGAGVVSYIKVPAAGLNSGAAAANTFARSDGAGVVSYIKVPAGGLDSGAAAADTFARADGAGVVSYIKVPVAGINTAAAGAGTAMLSDGAGNASFGQVDAAGIAAGAVGTIKIDARAAVGTIAHSPLFLIELNAEAAATPINFDLTTVAALAGTFRIIDAKAHCTGANAGGTLRLYDAAAGGGNAITDAVTCAVANVITQATVDYAQGVVDGAAHTISIVKNAAGDDGRMLLLCCWT